jgi:hypothetical protein
MPGRGVLFLAAQVSQNLVLHIPAQPLPIISADWIQVTSPFVKAADRARLIEGLSLAGLW